MKAKEFIELLEAMFPTRGQFPVVDRLCEEAEGYALRTIDWPGDPDFTRGAIQKALEAAFKFGCFVA